MVRRIISTALIAVIATAIAATFSGCMTSHEINRLAIVMGLGVDGKEGDYKITAQVAKPGNLKFSESADEDAYFNISCSERSIQMCMSKFERMLSREVYEEHIELILIGEDAARDGLGAVMEYFFRAADARISVPLIVTEGKAADMLDMELMLEKLPVTRLAGMIDTQLSDTHETALERTSLEVFMSDTLSYSAATIPLFGYNDEGEAEILGTAVFRDMAMCGVLTVDEARAMLMVKKKFGSGADSAELPDGSLITFKVSDCESVVTPIYKNGEFSINVRIYCEFSLSEDPRGTIQYTEAARLELESIFNRAIRERVLKVIARSRELNADVFGFGNKLWRGYPKESKQLLSNWGEEYRNLPVDVSVSSVMYSTGAMIKNIGR